MGDEPPPACLVVDDEEPFRWLLCAILQDAGYRCHSAADVAQARAVLGAEPVACVLLDVSLGGEGGLDFLRELRETHAGAAVVVVTGHHDPALAEAAVAAGARGFVTKPFKAQDVRAAVEHAISR
jgi:DNA-binding NtrC family response regulator